MHCFILHALIAHDRSDNIFPPRVAPSARELFNIGAAMEARDFEMFPD